MGTGEPLGWKVLGAGASVGEEVVVLGTRVPEGFGGDGEEVLGDGGAVLNVGVEVED